MQCKVDTRLTLSFYAKCIGSKYLSCKYTVSGGLNTDAQILKLHLYDRQFLFCFIYKVPSRNRLISLNSFRNNDMWFLSNLKSKRRIYSVSPCPKHFRLPVSVFRSGSLNAVFYLVFLLFVYHFVQRFFGGFHRCMVLRPAKLPRRGKRTEFGGYPTQSPICLNVTERTGKYAPCHALTQGVRCALPTYRVGNGFIGGTLGFFAQASHLFGNRDFYGADFHACTAHSAGCGQVAGFVQPQQMRRQNFADGPG